MCGRLYRLKRVDWGLEGVFAVRGCESVHEGPRACRFHPSVPIQRVDKKDTNHLTVPDGDLVVTTTILAVGCNGCRFQSIGIEHDVRSATWGRSLGGIKITLPAISLGLRLDSNHDRAIRPECLHISQVGRAQDASIIDETDWPSDG